MAGAYHPPLCIQAEVDSLDSSVVLSEPNSTQISRRFIMLCAKCGQPLRDGVKFCEKCGARVREGAAESAARTEKERLCGNCGCSVTTNSKTCKWCGAELKQTDGRQRARPPLAPDGHGPIEE